MKKKIVFVIPSLDAGGGEKSLINLLNTIDYNRFEVDLVLFSPKGLFLKLLPETVTIISLSKNHTIFSKDLMTSVLQFFLSGNIVLAYHRLVFTIKNKIFSKGRAEQYAWKNYKKSISDLTKNYDSAIGFLEKTSLYFVVDCVNANKKIGFIHNDYNKLNLDAIFDSYYLNEFDAIATVSEECATVLKEKFPSEKEKVTVIYNIVSERLINKFADEYKVEFNSVPTLLSIGRLHPQKGFDFAIESAKKIRDKGIPFQWIIIGEGTERQILERKIIENNLNDCFKLLGLKDNPYPYIKAATIYVQPSRYEGKSIAIDEAKILCKPILVTNFTTAKDQINNNKNGIIVEMNASAIAEGIEGLLSDSNLRSQLTTNLSLESLGTESEIEKLYQLIN